MYKDFLLNKNREILKNKEVTNENNNIFINMIQTIGDIGGFCLAHIILDINKQFHYNFYGHVTGQAIKFAKVIEKCVNNSLNKINANFSFFISLNDGVNFPEHITDFIKKHIIFVGCYSPIGDDFIILIPDLYMLMSEYEGEYNEVCRNIIPFNNKIPIAKFRGSQTGSGLLYNMTEVQNMTRPRLKAAHMSLEHPTLLDVRFIGSYDIQNTGGEEYINYMNSKFGPVSQKEPMKDFNQYRYVLCFDGNYAPPFARPEMIMASGSVPIFQTNYNKYWSFFLEDGINYVKIKDDLSDLIPAINNLNNNPHYSETIANNARELAKNVINYDLIREYFIETINIVSLKCAHL